MQNIKDEVLKYVELQVKYYKFEAVEKIGELRSSLIYRSFFLFVLFTFLIFIGLTFAFYLSEVFDSFYKGFGIVSLILMLFTVIAYFCKSYIVNSLLKKYLNKNIPS